MAVPAASKVFERAGAFGIVDDMLVASLSVVGSPLFSLLLMFPEDYTILQPVQPTAACACQETEGFDDSSIVHLLLRMGDQRVLGPEEIPHMDMTENHARRQEKILHVRLPLPVYRRLRHEAVERGLTNAQIIIEAIDSREPIQQQAEANR